jgi:hypothetical protein
MEARGGREGQDRREAEGGRCVMGEGVGRWAREEGGCRGGGVGRGQLGSRTGGGAGRAAAGPVGAGGPRIASTFLFFSRERASAHGPMW